MACLFACMLLGVAAAECKYAPPIEKRKGDKGWHTLLKKQGYALDMAMMVITPKKKGSLRM